jgi:NAD-dependent DNA ligase
MYSKDQTKKLQADTTSLIKKKDIGIKDLESLRNALRFHEYRYYILNDPLISDFEYDQLYKTLEKIEAENPKLITVRFTNTTGCKRSYKGFSDGSAFSTNAFLKQLI